MSLGALFVVVACSAPSEVADSPGDETSVEDASGDPGAKVSEAGVDDWVDLSSDSGPSDAPTMSEDSGESDSGVETVDSGPVPLSCATYLAGRPVPPGRTSVSCAKLNGTAQETLNYAWTSNTQYYLAQYPEPCGNGGTIVGSSYNYACCAADPFDSGKLPVAFAVYALIETFAEDGGVGSKLTLFHGRSVSYFSTYEFMVEGDLTANGTKREIALDDTSSASSSSLLWLMAQQLFYETHPPLPDSALGWTHLTGRGNGNVYSHPKELSVQAKVSAGSIDVVAVLKTVADSRDFGCVYRQGGSSGTFAYEGIGSLQAIP